MRQEDEIEEWLATQGSGRSASLIRIWDWPIAAVLARGAWGPLPAREAMSLLMSTWLDFSSARPAVLRPCRTPADKESGLASVPMEIIPDKRKVVGLVEQAYKGEICLPNFQRDFV
jgi:hypothetical protein